MNTPHLIGNQIALGALAALVWIVRQPRLCTLAWPLTTLTLIWWPQIGYSVGLSGVLHAGVLALGVQTPLTEIVAAALACRADVVALGFSAVLSPREVRAALVQLRDQLPAERALWSGGLCPTLKTTGRGSLKLEGYRHLPQLDDIAPAVAHWRANAGQPAASSVPAL